MAVDLHWDETYKGWFSAHTEPPKIFFGVYENSLLKEKGRYHITWKSYDWNVGDSKVYSMYANTWDEVLTFCELMKE